MNYEAQRPNPVEALFGHDLPAAVEGFLLIPLPLVLLSVAAGVVIERCTRRRSALKTLIQTTKDGYLKPTEIAAPQSTERVLPTPYDSARPFQRPIAVAAGVQDGSLTTYWEHQTPFKQVANTVPFEARKAMLERALKQHESGWLDKLLCCPCLLVIGRPGSAKSSFAGSLAICREVVLGILNATIIADPNAHLKAGERIWQPQWTLQGSRDNWTEIEAAMKAMYKRFADSQGRNYVSSVYDELTTYESKLDANVLSGFIEQITSKARASNEYITLVSHNDTLTCLGAKKGQARLKDDMVKLSLGSRSVARGTFQATGKGCIEGLEFDDKNTPLEELVTLPRWLEPKVLIELFPELYALSNEPGHRGNGSVPGPSNSGNGVTDPLPPGTNEILGGNGVTDPRHESHRPPGNGGGEPVTGDLSRALKIEQIRRIIFAELTIDISITTLETVIDSLEQGRSLTYIIKRVLGLEGREFAKGKYILKIIEDFNNNETDI